MCKPKLLCQNPCSSPHGLEGSELDGLGLLPEKKTTTLNYICMDSEIRSKQIYWCITC